MSTENIQRNNTRSWKSANIAKTSLDIFKKIHSVNPQKMLRKVYQISWNLDEVLKSYKTNYTGGVSPRRYVRINFYQVREIAINKTLVNLFKEAWKTVCLENKIIILLLEMKNAMRNVELVNR